MAAAEQAYDADMGAALAGLLITGLLAFLGFRAIQLLVRLGRYLKAEIAPRLRALQTEL